MSLTRTANQLVAAVIAAVGRLDKSLEPRHTLARLRRHTYTLSDGIYVLHLALALFWLAILPAAAFPLQLVLPLLFGAALLVPFTSQFFFRAIPVFAWLLAYFTSRYIPVAWRPPISVSFLPTLESVLYGANISDLLTRYTHPALDALSWLPYGIVHFALPFVVAAFLWLFRPKEALHLWARVFGYMNLTGVLIQILFPCAPPWYELIYGLTPADYSVRGFAGGLARIDRLFGGSGYQLAFGNSPVVFGAFPSLHAGCATLEALFLSHFFPQVARYAWTYTAIMYWSTMYLTHHYLIDVVAGACLAVAFFNLYLPDEFAGARALAPPTEPPAGAGLGLGIDGARARGKYAAYDLDPPAADALGGGAPSDDEEEADIAYGYRAPAGAAAGAAAKKKSHRHTASIASLIREGDRVEDGWSPIGSSFSFPPTPTRAQMDRDVETGKVPRA